jgi:hypothetical protein
MKGAVTPEAAFRSALVIEAEELTVIQEAVRAFVGALGYDRYVKWEALNVGTSASGPKQTQIELQRRTEGDRPWTSVCGTEHR